jgi:hypothetical protein
MDNSRSKHLSTLVGNCPSCTGYVRVPLDARFDATARCPHCGTTFSISDVLEQIPELEIVESTPPEKVVPLVDRQPITREPVVERKKFEVPHQLISGSKKKRRHKSQSVSGSGSTSASATKTEFALEPISTEFMNAGSDSENVDPLAVTIEPDKTIGGTGSISSARSISSAHAARVRVHSSQRQRRMREERKSNPVIEVIKIILGGLLAFPIAYLILIWGVGQDPLNLGPTISKAIPFAVPKKFQQPDDQEKPKTRRFRAIGGGTQETEKAEPKKNEKPEVPKLDFGSNPNLTPAELERRILSSPDVAPEAKSSSNENPKKD